MKFDFERLNKTLEYMIGMYPSSIGMQGTVTEHAEKMERRKVMDSLELIPDSNATIRDFLGGLSDALSNVGKIISKTIYDYGYVGGIDPSYCGQGWVYRAISKFFSRIKEKILAWSKREVRVGYVHHSFNRRTVKSLIEPIGLKGWKGGR